MKPLGRRVVVEREKTTDQIGSIVIPEKYRHQAQAGRVIAVGDRVTTVRIGDRVLFGKHSTLDMAEGVFIWESDLIAVLES